MDQHEVDKILPDGVLQIRQILNYTSIDVKNNEFRILTILPSNTFNETILCELSIAKYENETYEALSYTWGDPTIRNPIKVNGHDFFITSNLESAIRHLRRNEPRRIWIDAICINHQDIIERSQSIMKMHMIYNFATKVIIWLGEQSYDSEIGFDLLELASKSDDEKKGSIFDPSSTADNSSNWKALANIFDRPWWKRLWVIQEVAFSRGALMKCGQREMDFANLIYIVNQLFIPSNNPELDNYIRPRLVRARIIYTIFRMKFLIRGVIPAKLMGDMLIELRSAETTDPRDKFYGCIHLCGPIEDYPDVNYELSTSDLYTMIAKIIMTQEIGPRLLAACELQTRTQDDEDDLNWLTNIDDLQRTRIPKLPSWAPNWAIPRITTPLFNDFETDVGSGVKYNAAGDYPSEFHFIQEEESIPERLAVKGIIFDNVIATTKGLYPGDSSDFRKEILNLLLSLDIPSPYQNQAQALRLTLCLGNDTPDKTLPPDKMHSIPFTDRFRTAYRGRTFFVTSGGFFGLGPRGVEVEDVVSVIFGTPIPIVLRSVGKQIKLEGNTCEVHDDLSDCFTNGCGKDVKIVETSSAFMVVGESCKCSRLPFHFKILVQ